MPRPRTDIRSRILRAARRLFVARGVDGTPLRTIARDARTSIGMVYYYFRTKDELFFAVVDEVYAALLADLERALAPGVPAPQRLRRLFARLARVSDVEVDTVRLVARELLSSSARRDRLFERFRRGHVRLVAAAIADGVREGSLRDDVPQAAIAAAAIALAGPAQLVRRALGDAAPLAGLPAGDDLADALVDLLLAGAGR